jgi:hypothetical protein
MDAFQCFQLQKLENTKINDSEDIYKLFSIGKDAVVYFCVLNGKQLVIYKPKSVTENENIIVNNGPKNFILLYNSKGEPCYIADISNNELDIVIY